MTYAGNRRIIDVDSHLFELDDFLHAVATDEEAAFIRPMEAQTELPVSLEAINRGREHLDRRNADPELMTKFEAGMFDIGRSPWSRLGAFDPAERSHALDVLGFERQIVLGTFSFHQIAHEDDAKALEIGARVHNRAMGRFCAHDERLLAGGYVPLSLGLTWPAHSSTRPSPMVATRSWWTRTRLIQKRVRSRTPTWIRSGLASLNGTSHCWYTSR